MARRKLYNKLMGGGLGGTPMPMGVKLDQRWLDMVYRRQIETGEPTVEAEQDALRVLSAAINEAIGLVGRDVAARLLLTAAGCVATPTRDGRPKGATSRATRDTDRDHIAEVLRLCDGKSDQRDRAIAKVAASVPEHQRAAFRRRLQRKIPLGSIGEGADKK